MINYNFGIGILFGFGFVLLQEFIDYFMHRKDKLCYHCGHPYMDKGNAS